MPDTPDYLAAIEKRQSRRTYSPEPIDERAERQLKQRIGQYNREGRLSVSWMDDGGAAFTAMKSYGIFTNIRSVIVLKGPRSTPDLRERLGYYGELLVLEATAMGLGSCWIAGTFDRNSELFRLDEEEELVSLISVGNIQGAMSFKERLVYRTVGHRRKPLESFYSADSPVPPWFLSGIRAVAKAPSAVNSQRVRFRYSQEKVTASIPGNRETDPIDLGIAKLHFALAAGGVFEFGFHGEFRKQ